MRRWSIRQKANGILALAAAGILAAFPFQHTFIGGLLFAAFSAATIGGLADSFAVSALFGNPLSIRWPGWMGTRVISKNRERLVDELVSMVEKELLTVETIQEALKDYNLSAVLLRYLEEHGGKQDVQAIMRRLAAELLAGANPKALAIAVERLAADNADALRISDLLADAMEWSIRQGYDERIIAFLLAQLRKLALTTEFRMLAEQMIESAVRSYEGDKFRRRLVDYTAGLNAHALSGKAQEWLASMLEQLAEPDHPLRLKLQKLIHGMPGRLRSDEKLRADVEAGKLKMLAALKEHAGIQEWLKQRMVSLGEALRQETGHSVAAEGEVVHGGAAGWLDGQVETALGALSDSRDRQIQLDRAIKSALMSALKMNHYWIGRLVRDKLDTFTEQDMITLVKDKAGRDLQYIRLNGMIVGSLVGALLFLLTFWIGGTR